MQRYTQEASGCKQQEPPPEAQPSHYRKPLSCSTQPKPAPAVRTKENMGHVLGEFRKFSDSESPKRPSANRKGRSRDPCHYQHYYVARRPPSAIDFVCTDDAMSDTNSATSSLSSSYDLGSTCSSRRLNGVMQRNDDVREAQQQRGPPPKVAPKPKLERFLSADPTLVADRPGETKDDGDNIDVNHQLGINNGESHNTGEENGGSLNSAPVNGDREISKPAFSVWSPGSGSSEMPTFPKLPPPPNYHDVTPAPSVIPRPTFNAIKHVQQAVNGVIPVTESPPQVTVAKPRFTTTKTPETWKPNL
uniref:Uncharacterized protein n=2 Tax=Ciona savignyi TaxID=51511 RepID=H2Y775_CIOSA